MKLKRYFRFNYKLFNKVKMNSNNNENQLVVGFISYPQIDLAKSTARLLVEKELVACAKVLPGLISYYKWENKLEEDNEIYLIIKTLKSKVNEIDDLLSKTHTNQIYEFIYFNAEATEKYSKWVKLLENTKDV